MGHHTNSTLVAPTAVNRLYMRRQARMNAAGEPASCRSVPLSISPNHCSRIGLPNAFMPLARSSITLSYAPAFICRVEEWPHETKLRRPPCRAHGSRHVGNELPHG